MPKEGPLRAPASLYPNGPELEELNVISAFSENLRSILAKTLNENIVTFYGLRLKNVLNASFPLCEGVSCLSRM